MPTTPYGVYARHYETLADYIGALRTASEASTPTVTAARDLVHESRVELARWDAADVPMMKQRIQ
jgi:hypothetical protein